MIDDSRLRSGPGKRVPPPPTQIEGTQKGTEGTRQLGEAGKNQQRYLEFVICKKKEDLRVQERCEAKGGLGVQTSKSIYILIINFHIMSSLRHQKDLSFEEEAVEGSESEADSVLGRKLGKVPGRPGRPRGKGRPKRTSKQLHRGESEDEEEWQEKAHVREKAPPPKEESSIEGYIKIIDYLKKIDYDEGSLQNKMNPYNALTASSFWYAISAEYFSFDFNSRRNSHDVSVDILEKIQKLPLCLHNRSQKTLPTSALIDLESQELHKLGVEMSEKMGHLVPAPLAYRPELVQRKIPTTSVAEDDQFLSSTRSIIHNYIARKVKSSEKWAALLASYSKELGEIPPKEFEGFEPLQLPKEEEPTKEVNLFELLRQQAKKKIQKREKPKQSTEVKEGDLFQEESHGQSDHLMKEEQPASNNGPMEQINSEHKQPQQGVPAMKAQKCIEVKVGGSQELLYDEQAEKMDVEVEEKEDDDLLEKMEEEQAYKLEQGNNPEQANKPEEEPAIVVFQPIEDLIKQEQIMFSQTPVIIAELQPHDDPKGQQQVSQPRSESLKYKQQIVVQKMTFKKTYNQQDFIVDSILHLPLDKLISILQSHLPTIQLPEIKQSLMPIPTKDPLEFVFQLHPEEERYLEYMKQHRKKKYHEKVAKGDIGFDDDERDGQCEDAKCQICTDGDYTDDNLIVFCSLCNISLHQRCVGLAKVPAESWVCDVCIAFGPAGINLPCPLCNIKGGAMKRTAIHIDTNIFKQTNPTYNQYSKKCPYSKQKEEYIPKQKVEGQEELEQGDKEALVKVVREKGEKQEECYYDYFVKSTYPSTVPTCHYVWVHYVCAIWVPECYFQQKNGMISVKGIENIDHKRFKSECFVCEKNKCGASVKCEDFQCSKYYHPECARKKKVYMEQLNLQKLKYLIFCEEHEPLKLTRQIEYKKKKNREEIIKFARMIEKYIETYRIAQFPFKLMKSAVPHNFIDTYHKTERDDLKDRKALAANNDEAFLKVLIANLSKAKMMTVHMDKVENGYKITNVETPSKRQIRKCLNRYDQFWNSIHNGDTVEENFRRYERIMLENQRLRQKLEHFLNGTLSPRSKTDDKKYKKSGRKRGRQAEDQIETLIQEEGCIFCVCKKPYEGETDMFECQVCGQWYHFRCLGFIGSEDDAQKMEFICMKCMKFEGNETKQERLERYAGLFSLDSILYLYRPPTPDLLSEEEVEEKNYQEIMNEYNKQKSPKNSPKKERVESISLKKEQLEDNLQKIQPEQVPIRQTQEKQPIQQNEIRLLEQHEPEPEPVRNGQAQQRQQKEQEEVIVAVPEEVILAALEEEQRPQSEQPE